MGRGGPIGFLRRGGRGAVVGEGEGRDGLAQRRVVRRGESDDDDAGEPGRVIGFHGGRQRARESKRERESARGFKDRERRR